MYIVNAWYRSKEGYRRVINCETFTSVELEEGYKYRFLSSALMKELGNIHGEG